jgi:hypothetical protein
MDVLVVNINKLLPKEVDPLIFLHSAKFRTHIFIQKNSFKLGFYSDLLL